MFFAKRLSWALGAAVIHLHSRAMLLPLSIKSRLCWQDQMDGASLPIIGSAPPQQVGTMESVPGKQRSED
jgi:hypothetical protein